MTAADSSHFLTNATQWPKSPPEFTPIDLPGLPTTRSTDAIASIQPGQLAVWVERFAHLGVTAARVGCPALAAQLTAALSRPIERVICSALDTDASTCVQTATVARFPQEVCLGVAMLERMLEPQSATVLIDASVPEQWFDSLRPVADQLGLRVSAMQNPYPQADPTLLIFSLAQRRMRPRTLPTDHGIVLIDAVAAYAMGRALSDGQRVTHQPVVVRQHASNRSRYALVPTDMTVGRLLDRVNATGGGFVRAGDLLRDIRVRPETTIDLSERVFHVCPTEPPVNPDPCTRCGWCVDVCPTRVHPATALDAAQQEDSDLAERAGIGACIECGICTFVCPAQLPLMAAIRTLKRDT